MVESLRSIKKPMRWLMIGMTAIGVWAVSVGVEANFSIECNPSNGPVPETDTDADGIPDCFDTNVLQGSKTFAFPDACKTPEPAADPFPFTLRFGLRNILSDYGDSTQGGLASGPRALALEASGAIIASANSGLSRINSDTGFRSLFSDFSNFDQGPLVPSSPQDIAIASAQTGEIFFLGGGGVLMVDPSTGVRTLISDFTDSAQGPVPVGPRGYIAIDSAGTILITDTNFAGKGRLYRIDPRSGIRTILSDFGNSAQGPLGASPWAVAADHEGNILVADAGTLILYKVDPITGYRTVLSNLGSSSQGPVMTSNLEAIAVEETGGILVVDASYGEDFRGALFFVDPVSGFRQIISDFSNLVQGDIGLDPLDVAIGNTFTYVIDLHGFSVNSPGVVFKVRIHDATSGTITSKGDQNLKITNKEPGSEVGIRVVADETTFDLVPATISFCGSSALVTLSKGDDIVGTCGSVTLEVISGSVETQFVGDSGEEATTTLGAGNSISFDPSTLTFNAPQTNNSSIAILLDGLDLIVEPGETVVAFSNVDIDIKPGSDPNCLNNNGHGVITVAILSRTDFDATRVDPLTVSLDGQTVGVVGKKGNVQSHAEDVNTDGFIDLVLQIIDVDGTYAVGDAIAILTGNTFEGTSIQGTDTICIVP